MTRRLFLALAVPIALCATASLASAQQKEATIKIVSPSQAVKALKKNPKMVVIDLRTAKEFAQGHIPKAINIDFTGEGFEKEIAKLDRKKSYLIHCRSGARSARSLPTWKKHGFTDVIHLKTGILGWQQVGLALTEPKSGKK